MQGKTIFITGISSGIGEALFEALSQNNEVYGIGRSNPNKVANFLSLDLKSSKALAEFQFPSIEADELLLINNAGIIGPVKPIQNQSAVQIEDVYQVNLTAPSQLTQKFIQQFESKKLTILNISSGAARSIIPSWSTYCASKAGLDAFTLVCQAECVEQDLDVKLYAVAPGVVDTEMQSEIRSKKEEDFSRLSNFISLKENNELVSPQRTANTLIQVLEKEKNLQTVFSLRDFY